MRLTTGTTKYVVIVIAVLALSALACSIPGLNGLSLNGLGMNEPEAAQLNQANAPVPAEPARPTPTTPAAVADPEGEAEQAGGAIEDPEEDEESGAAGAPAETENGLFETADVFVGECRYVDTGSSQPLNVPRQFVPGTDYYYVDLKQLEPGCALLFEGRVPWQRVYPDLEAALLAAELVDENGEDWDSWDSHGIVDLRSYLGEFDPRPYNELLEELGVHIPEEYMDYFLYEEGSFWAYDQRWNISDYGPEKPSIAEEFETKKTVYAMIPNGYLYPRWILQPDGDLFLYAGEDTAIDDVGDIFHACTKGDDIVEYLPVHGLWVEDHFQASIGAGFPEEGCLVAVWIDGDDEPQLFRGYYDGERIVEYDEEIEAVIFGDEFTEEDAENWLADFDYTDVES